MGDSNGVSYLTRDDILGGRAFRSREIRVGEKMLRVRELFGSELIELQREEKEKGDDPEKNIGPVLERSARVLAKTAIDSDGKRLFQDEDVPKIIESTSTSTLLDAYRAIAGLSGTTQEAAAKLGES